MPQPPQVTRFQSVEPPVNPPPARIAYFEENPPPYCDWASYPATAPEIPLNRASAMRDLEVDRPSTDVNLLTQSPETRFVPQRPQLPEPLIPGLAPPPTSHSSVNPDPKPLPSYRSKMEEAAQSGNFINFLGDTSSIFTFYYCLIMIFY